MKEEKETFRMQTFFKGEERIMKKTWKVLTGLVLVASLLAGCGASGAAKFTTAAQGENATKAAAEGEAAKDGEEKKGLKIAIVSSPSGVDDGSFNQDNYNGILSFIEKHPDATVTPVREETGDTAAVMQAVNDIVADYDVLVCCGFQFAGIGTIAKDNPDTKLSW